MAWGLPPKSPILGDFEKLEKLLPLEVSQFRKQSCEGSATLATKRGLLSNS